MRSSIDEALLRTITINPGIQNDTVNACSYLDLTVKPDTSKMNASTASTQLQLADVVAIAGNTPSLHSHAQVSSSAAATAAAAAMLTTSATTSNTSSSSSQYNHAPICLVAHLSSNINQDLAEADQSIENDVTNNENAANSPELLNTSVEHNSNDNGHGCLIQNNEILNEGAVGGIIMNEAASSTLPDLAKVTTNTNNSDPDTVTSNCDIDYVDTDL